MLIADLESILYVICQYWELDGTSLYSTYYTNMNLNNI